MNTTSIAYGALLFLCLFTIGCGPSHRTVPMIEAGYPLHLVVDVPDKMLADAQGTVFYSLPADRGDFVSKPLELRGNDLVTTLETRQLVPGERSPPDLPGVVEQAMVYNGKQWIAEVPGQRVAPGSWSYRIEANVQDILYANPAEPNTSLYFTVPAAK